jgi:ribonuclease J
MNNERNNEKNKEVAKQSDAPKKKHNSRKRSEKKVDSGQRTADSLDKREKIRDKRDGVNLDKKPTTTDDRRQTIDGRRPSTVNLKKESGLKTGLPRSARNDGTLRSARNDGTLRSARNDGTLKIAFLGGVGEIGKNLTVLEFNNEMLVIDAGLAFPTYEEMPGIDYVIPDFTYLTTNAKKIKAIVVTHGHEDHIGALPYVLKEVKVPVYGSTLAMALVQAKLDEHKIKDVKLNAITDRSTINLGSFCVEFVRVTHSTAGSFALHINTPKGRLFHTGDFKIDHTPIDGKHIDLTRIAEIGSKGVLLMMSDSTNVGINGYSMSERNVGKSLDTIFGANIHKRIIVSTFASNIHRIQQILNCALKYGRYVACAGRSMDNIIRIAGGIKELKCPPDLIVDIDKIGKIPFDKICILATGSQGEPSSALSRMSLSEFRKVTIGKDDTVVLSASPIPGNEKTIFKVINNLYRKGADVVYNRLADVHVSGHACREELRTMLALVKPKFFIPVHGEYRHLKQHAELASQMGIMPANIAIPELGEAYEISMAGFKKLPAVPHGIIMLDESLLENSEMLLRDRKLLSEDGFIIALANVTKVGELISPPLIISRGINLSDDIIEEIKSEISLKFNVNIGAELDPADARNEIRKAAAKVLFNRLRRRPMVIPVTIES